MFSYMRQGPAFYREVVVLAIPIVLQNLITNSLGLLDTFMVGMLGELPMAAVTLANIPIFVILLLIFGLQSGGSVLIAQFWGKGDADSINRVMGIGVYVAGSISVCFALVMFFFPQPFMGLFSNNAEIVALAAEYARIVGFSYIFNSITSVYIGAHRSMENPKLGLGILSVSMVSNTFLNWVLIFGKLGAPRLGVVGAAAATLISRIIEFAVMLLHARFSRRFRLRLALLLRPGRALLKSYARFATPVVLNETLWGLGSSLYPTIMGYMAESTPILAAYAISGNIEKVCTVVVFALAGTASILIGREIGAGRKERVYDLGRALNTLSLLAGLVVGALMVAVTLLAAAPFLYPLFGLSSRAAEIATMMQIVVFSTLFIRAFNTTNIVGVLRGGGDVRAASVIDVLPLWAAALPLAAIAGLVFRLDILWVYLCTVVENLVKFLLGMLRFRSGVWIHDVTITRAAD
ncbi:MATE family efflux transporter [Lawsonibacter celer]|uniref:MATE family efflux transporter n=1 Tax=Lawsonibacter celer TaxID=2986526 RepID=UPI001646565A|nr:MATE family efflux transporter [Lawsonibacter celer]